MRLTHAIVPVLLLSHLSGCAWMKARLPWGKRGVPVTSPTETTSAKAREPAESSGAETNGLQPVMKSTTASPTTKAAAVRIDRHTAPQSPTRPAEGDSPKPRGTGSQKDAKLVAAAVLQVNDRYITVEEVLEILQGQFAALPKDTGKDVFRLEVRKIIDQEIRSQIQEALVLVEAEKRISEELSRRIDAEMEQILNEMIAEAGGSRKKLEQTLAQDGENLKTILENHRRKLTVQLYLRDRFMPAISITRRMLWDYYRTHRSEFAAPEKVQMQIIAAPFKAFLAGSAGRPTAAELKAAKADAKQLIDEAYAAVKAGEDYGEVAKRLSRGLKARVGGLWRMMEGGSFGETKVETAAFALREGQVSEILETQTGYYIVKAKKVQPGKVTSFEDAQEKIDDLLRQQQYRKLTAEYFKRLLKGATIVRSDEFLESAVDLAVEKHWR